MSHPVLIAAMGGLGDTIYQRPGIAAAAAREGRVWVRTAWPELLEGIPGVTFVYPHSINLRTQELNADRQPDTRWARGFPPRNRTISPHYPLRVPGTNILRDLEEHLPIDGPLDFTLPDFGPPPVKYKRYAVVRPVTIRKEWANPARAPNPGHVAEAASILQAQGYKVVTVAHLKPGEEWVERPYPHADLHQLHGEFSITELCSLVQHASVVVGGPGWIVPMSLAYGTPMVCICGGQLGYNHPDQLTDPRMDLTRTRFLMPSPACRCKERLHTCPKDIPDFSERFADALEAVT